MQAAIVVTGFVFGVGVIAGVVAYAFTVPLSWCVVIGLVAMIFALIYVVGGGD